MTDFSFVQWRKSSHSDGDSGMCVEVARGWRKSSHSGGNSGQCAAFGNLLARVKAGALDL